MTRTKIRMERDSQINALELCITQLNRIFESYKDSFYEWNTNFDQTKQDFHDEINETLSITNEKMELN